MRGTVWVWVCGCVGVWGVWWWCVYVWGGSNICGSSGGPSLLIFDCSEALRFP